ncbi:lactonase family protein [Angustibacter sp. McL0619]|uniref:lactonase family protein n=1 Tax=Angustibacter sp. McL0619 TaxID=3415676 RepID=UPI003CEE9897
MGTTDLLIGSYTTGTGSPGVVRASLDDETGALEAAGEIALTDPSWIALSQDRRTLYAVGEHVAGTLTSVALHDPSVRTERDGAGDDPCHLILHRGHAVVAGYSSGTVAVFALGPGGELGRRTQLLQHNGSGSHERQEAAHAHQVCKSPDGRHLLVVDLGTDSVTTYRLDDGPDGPQLVPVSRAQAPPGSGPRNLTFHPGGRAALLALELTPGVAVCTYDPDSGALSIGTVVLAGVDGLASALLITQDGHHAYLGMRDQDGTGTDAVLHFAMAVAGSAVRRVGLHPSGGRAPRHLRLSPDERWLLAANQLSGTVTSLPVDRLGAVGAPVGFLDVPGAACVVLA